MFGIRTRIMVAAIVASLTSPVALMAQWGSDCSCYSPQQYVTAPAPVVTTACQCLQPVTKMVSRQMQVTEYVPQEKREKRTVKRLAYESQQVPVYQQKMVTKTIEVPTVQYQTQTVYQTQVIPKTQWRTVVQPVPKMAACQYDNRPGMMGAMNRWGYSVRSAFQPNYLTHRQQVSQVCQCKVPVQRQVAVQTMRQVAIQEPVWEKTMTTQQVAKWVDAVEEVTVTEMVPKTVTRTVQVPETRYAAVTIDPFTGMAIAPAPTTTAKAPEPTRAAENDTAPADGLHKGISYPKPAASSSNSDHRVIQKSTSKPTRTPTQVVKVTKRAATVAADDDGWTAHESNVAATPLAAPAKAAVATTQP